MTVVKDLERLTRTPDGVRTFIERPDGTRLHCIAQGEGPTVVLAHGIFNELRCFNLVLEQLRTRHVRIILFDQRGHGQSSIGGDGLGSRQMAGDYRAVLEYFDVTEGILVGHSMGAFLAVVLAEHYPQVVKARLQAMLLVSGHAGIAAKGSLQNQLQIPLIRVGLMPLILSSRWLGRIFIRTLFGKIAKEEHVEVTRAILAANSQKDRVSLVDFQVREDHYPALGQIKVPTTVVCGEQDRTCPRWHSERLGAEIPDARNVWLPDVGHAVVYEAPEIIDR
ncbi:MAG: alpha/beta hydrolase, partial [Gammaproteobacteria bacterium]|nr:alpha/beta hydrolase [Gammaproteobacteria bacterium]